MTDAHLRFAPGKAQEAAAHSSKVGLVDALEPTPQGLHGADIEVRLGDGVFFGDMTGNGVDDYIWIDWDGNLVIFVNRNSPPDTSKYPNGEAWDDKGVQLSTGLDIKALHIGDWNGDGKADVIGVNKKTGELTVWLTSYENGSFSFNKITSGGTYCTNGWGVGRYDIAAHFADILGNGCVDYICLDADGRATAWMNHCSNGDFDLEYVGQVKAAIGGKERANIRFADINGRF